MKGERYPAEEIVAFAGPDHCGWQTATFLLIGWPPGTFANTADRARQYIRDPKGAVDDTFRKGLALRVEVPPDARASGYRVGSIEIYLSPADQDAVPAEVGTSQGVRQAAQRSRSLL